MSKLPVGIQVYGLRDLLENTPEDFEKVMTEIKAMGYDGVELAGLYGIEPAKVKEILDRVGLVPMSAHVAFAEMVENLEQVIADYKVIGVKYLVMPYLPEEYRPANPEGFLNYLKELGKVGARIHEAGFTLLYHNHDFEFVKMPEGDYGYDRMFEMIPADDLQSELDTCWCDVAIQKPAEYVKKYAGRLPVLHLKDYIKKGEVKSMYKLIGVEDEEAGEETGFFEFRPIGFGQMIWEPILKEAEEGGTKWVVVEQDEHYDLSPLECARRSREYLKILGW